MAGEDERLDAVPIKAAEAAAALESLKAPAQEAATAIEDAFGRAGDSLTRSLTRAAADGEVTLAELARAVLNAVNSAAGARGGGLSGAIAAALGGFGGARADGGPVLGGGAYLVGERGPELFTPAGHGAISPAGSFGGRGAVTVNVTARDAQSFLRSEGQIAAMLSRAVMRGQRNL